MKRNIECDYSYQAAKILVLYWKTRHENKVVDEVQELIDVVGYGEIMYCLRVVYDLISGTSGEMAEKISNDGRLGDITNCDFDVMMHLVILLVALQNRRSEIVDEEE